MKMRIERGGPKPLQVHELTKTWYVVIEGPLTRGLLVRACRGHGINGKLELSVGGWSVYGWDFAHVYESRYAEADLTTIREKDGNLYVDPLEPVPAVIAWKDAKYGIWYEIATMPKHLRPYQLAMRCGDALLMCAGDDCCLNRPPLGAITLRSLNPGDKIVFEDDPEAPTDG